MVTEDKLSFKLDLKGSQVVVRLKGAIDEDANFEMIKALGGPLVFNFSEVTAINSCGVRNWVNFLKGIGHKVFLTECPPLIVKQLNMVPSFRGEGDVLSIYLPYVCDACGHERTILLGKDQFFNKSVKLEDVITCDKCGQKQMEFDGTAEQYFAFAK